MKKKKELHVNCKAFPGEDMVTNPRLVEWCKENQHRAKCLGCRLFPVNGPDVSIFQAKEMPPRL